MHASVTAYDPTPSPDATALLITTDHPHHRAVIYDADDDDALIFTARRPIAISPDSTFRRPSAEHLTPADDAFTDDEFAAVAAAVEAFEVTMIARTVARHVPTATVTPDQVRGVLTSCASTPLAS